MKSKFSSDDNLPWEKTIEVHVVIIIIRLVFNDGYKYHQMVFTNLFTDQLNKYKSWSMIQL